MRIVFALALLFVSTSTALSWQSQSRTSPVDDSEIETISVEAVGTYKNRYGREGRAQMIIQCEQNTTLLALVLPQLYTSDITGLGNTTFRIDGNTAFERQMVAANDRGSLALTSGRAISTIRDMLGGNQLFVRVLTVSEPAKDLWFDIAGIDEAIAPIRENCGW